MARGHPEEPLKTAHLTPLGFFLSAAGFCFLWGLVGSSQVVHQPRYNPPATPGDFGIPWEPVSLISRDHLQIAGWFIEHPNPRGALILLHGIGTSKADLLDFIKELHPKGPYHLLAIDFRGHGASAGRVLSFGKEEAWDVEAGLRFLSEDPRCKGLPVGCYGISMGGAIGILAASRFPRLEAVVSDSSYADFPRAIARGVWMSYHIPRIPLGQIVIWGTAIRLWCRMSTVSPVFHIRKIAPRPILLIHGARDQTTPLGEGLWLHEAAGEPKEFWLVPGAEHVGSFYQDPSEYLTRVVNFFNHVFSRAA